jgi:tetratricopeptide (TPR) repeat protein
MPYAATLTLALFVAPAAQAQFPPEKLKNLKVFPQDIPVRALIDTMAGFTRALGVRCQFCHVGKEGEPLATFDFVSDEKHTKLAAREMLAMVAAINGSHLSKLEHRHEPRITVTCFTCHRGVNEPRPLQQILLIAYDSGGANAVEGKYRELRERYYGSASYDFGEVPLADVAGALRQRNPADALRFFVLNTEFSPNSAFAHRMAGAAQLAAGDTAKAIASLERALVLRPNDQQTQRTLEALKKQP